MNILIYTVGDRQSGMGHVQRQSVLTRELIRRGHYIEFVTLANTSGHTRLGQFFSPQEYPSVHITGLANAGNVSTHIRSHPLAELVIIDIEHGPAINLLLHAKHNNRKVVVLGGVGFPLHDPHSIDELVDLQIYQGVVVSSMSRERSVSNMLVGPEYVIVDPNFLDYRFTADNIDRAGILVSMGGSDPHDMSYQVVSHIQKMTKEPISVVVGPGMARPHYASELVYHAEEIIYNPVSLAPHMARHKYLVTALGMTVYEALCIGIPVACTAWSLDHEDTASRLDDDGYIAYLGLWDRINWTALERDTKHVISQDMTKRIEYGRALIDGLGVQRVASALEAL